MHLHSSYRSGKALIKYLISYLQFREIQKCRVSTFDRPWQSCSTCLCFMPGWWDLIWCQHDQWLSRVKCTCSLFSYVFVVINNNCFKCGCIRQNTSMTKFNQVLTPKVCPWQKHHGEISRYSDPSRLDNPVWTSGSYPTLTRGTIVTKGWPQCALKLRGLNALLVKCPCTTRWF